MTCLFLITLTRIVITLWQLSCEYPVSVSFRVILTILSFNNYSKKLYDVSITCVHTFPSSSLYESVDWPGTFTYNVQKLTNTYRVVLAVSHPICFSKPSGRILNFAFEIFFSRCTFHTRSFLSQASWSNTWCEQVLIGSAGKGQQVS